MTESLRDEFREELRQIILWKKYPPHGKSTRIIHLYDEWETQ